MLSSWLSSSKRPSKRHASRAAPSSANGLEFSSVPEFLRKPVFRADSNPFSGAVNARMPGQYREQKRSHIASADFNPLRSGGRFKLASSPIDSSLLETSKSPFAPPKARTVSRTQARSVASDGKDFKIAAEVLRAVNQYAIEKKKEIKYIKEAEVVEVLLKNIDNVFQVPFAYNCFLAFAVNEFTDELVRFYKDATDASAFFKGELPFHVAKRLYDEYIVANAPHEINVSGKMKEDIKARLDEAAVDEGSVSVDALDACLFEVRSLMEDQTFSRFKRKVNRSRPYAQAVWSGEIRGIDDFELENRDTILLYNLFADVKTGLHTLKMLTKMTRQETDYVRKARAKHSTRMYNSAAFVPTRVGDLRYDEY